MGTTFTRNRPARRRQILGWVAPPSLATFGLMIVASFVFCWVILAGPPNTRHDIIGVAPYIAIVVWVNVFVATPLIVGLPSGHLQVDGLILRRTIPAAEVVELVTDDGLILRTRAGKNIRAAAYPWSRSGKLVGYPRPKAAKRRIEKFLSTLPETCREASGDVSTQPRYGAALGATALAALLVMGAILLN